MYVSPITRALARCLLLGLLIAASGCDDDGATRADDDTLADSETGTLEPDAGDSDTTSDGPPDLPARCAPEGDQLTLSQAGDGRRPVIAFAELGLIAFGYDELAATPDWDLHLLPLPTAGEPGEELPLTDETPLAERPAIVGAAGGFGLVWREARWDPVCAEAAEPGECLGDLAFAHFSPDLQNLATIASPGRLTVGEDVVTGPRIGATSDGYVVAYGTDAAVRAFSMSTAGVVSGGPITLSDGASPDPGQEPALASSQAGGGGVVLWIGAFDDELWARGLDAAGAPIGDPFLLDEGHFVATPMVASDDTGYLAVWRAERNGVTEVFAQRLTLGLVPDGEPRQLTWSGYGIGHLTVAPGADNAGYVVAYTASRETIDSTCAVESCANQLFAIWTDALGAPLSRPLLLTDDQNGVSNPALAWHGSGWSVVYEIRRNLRWQIFGRLMTCQ